MKDPATHFQPWIGKNYRSPGRKNKRVMVLGESHYEWLDNQSLASDWTRQSIEHDIIGKKHRFRTRVAAVFLGHRPTTPEERGDFWHSVAFTNYIPVSVGRGAKKEPTEEMWSAAIPRFSALIAEHEPQFLLVLGHELWRRVHYSYAMDGRPEPHLSPLGEWRMWRYRITPDQTILACATTHPSSRGFDFNQWHPFVETMLKLA
ncbi:hypothetical protein [Nannocystis bainbridge]|uniref:Uracil DNA glycosylase superfamily protein n=1 Tax=Nannocystis bainbridge TaxID=2995303 RepID=A0ABT5E715_9BACT|nr:hypothetical protein [Nannocystis bainbridge]MDC0721656.1 hypothetical protein [Nannocystis bainbridge]